MGNTPYTPGTPYYKYKLIIPRHIENHHRIFGHPEMPLGITFLVVLVLVLLGTLLKNLKIDNKRDNWCYN